MAERNLPGIMQGGKKMDENIVISIARQYGSGGRTVGKMLAEKLGISFYDKEIIRMASDESGIDLKLFGKAVSYTHLTLPTT